MTRAAAKRPTVAKADDWFELSRGVVAQIDQASHGDRESAYRRIAAELGVSIHVPRRLARANRFLAYVAEVDDPALATRLQTQPLTCISVLSRWSNYAPDRALRAAERLVACKLNLASLTAEEEADRRTGERVSGATDRAWQTYASKRAVELVTSLDPSAELAWAARGWGLARSRYDKPPGLLAQLDHLPVLHLVFRRPGRADGRPLAVSVLSNQGERPRMPTLVAQVILTLAGYARLGYDALLLCGLIEDLDIASRVLDQIGQPPDVEARLIELG